MKYNFDIKAHAHTLDGSPLYGTSTVIKETMPPFLAKWGAQCAVDYIKDSFKDEPEVAIGSLLWDTKLAEAVNAWSKVRKEAATKGSDLHEELEKYVNLMIADQGGRPMLMNDAKPEDPEWKKIQDFAEWAVAAVDTFIFAEKNTYSKELWVGGIVDCLAKMKDGTLAVIDFKSSKEAYFNQFAQAAGYALQLEESGAFEADGTFVMSLEGKIAKLVVVPFGGKKLKPEIIENVEGYKEVFKSLVTVYGFLNSFNKK